MANLKTYKQGDTAPVLTATLLDAGGDPVDIAGATVRLLLVDAFSRLPYLEADADNDQVDEETTGHVSYDPSDGQLTLEVGTYRGEFEVTFQDGSIESFPNGGIIDVVVLPKAVGPEPSS